MFTTRSYNPEISFEVRQASPGLLEEGLYVVATPLGNLGDITLRGISVLRSVSCVYAEDTRHSIKLFNVLDIKTPLISCHSHNEASRVDQIKRKIQAGQAVGLISDAGTPGISDPGSKVVAAVVKEGLRVVPIPGPSAGIAALVASGLDTGSFLFIGFLPKKKGDREVELAKYEDVDATMIIYVGPSDLLDTLSSCVSVFGPDRRCCIAKEVTKIHEAFERVTLREALERYGREGDPRGEITLLIEGAASSTGLHISDEIIISHLMSQIKISSSSISEAVKRVSIKLGVKKRRVYKLALSLKDSLD